MAEEPADMGGLAIAAADVGASILIPGYDLVRCNMEGNCEWTDWVLGVGEIAISATGVGYGARVLAKAGIKGGAGAATRIADESETVQRWMSRAELEATRETGLLRGGREGTHFVTDAANRSARRARIRLALEYTPEVRVTMEIPANALTPPKRVPPLNRMPGGGMEREATGIVPVIIKRVDGTP